MTDVASRPRLLILDDIKQVGATIAAVARSAEFEARAVTEPMEFFEALKSWAPQYMVIDLVMPKMDGVEVIRLLAGMNCKARLIISSGVGSRVLDAARRAAAEHGLDIVGVLSKPFRSADLKAILVCARTGESAQAERRPAGDLVPVQGFEIEAALNQNQLRLVYQPKIDCRTGAVKGFEALLRWAHPTRGNVPPDQFIPVAEQSGLIQEITSQVVKMGLAWLSSTFADSAMGLSLNVSAVNLDRGDFVRRVVALCRASEIATSRVTLELTETATMRDPIGSLALFTQLRTQGFALSIDDFGTGYSSMVQLVRLPFSEMKVDRSFVMTALQSAESRAVIECISRLGSALGLGIVAEGVEDLAVIPFLNKVGVQCAQGFAVSRGIEGDQIPAWLEAWNARPHLDWTV